MPRKPAHETMASFIPNHRKKLERLRRLEADLRRLIGLAASEEKLLKAAAEIRDCRIRVLRAKQNKNPERTVEEKAVFLKDDDKIAALGELSPEAVLAEYR
jgi:hypothetical protein